MSKHIYALSIQIENVKLFHGDRSHPRRARNTSQNNKKRALRLKADSAFLRVMKSSVTITSTIKLLLFTHNMIKTSCSSQKTRKILGMMF